MSATISPDYKSSRYRVVSGDGALDGTNPTPVTTGLSSIVAAVLSLKGSVAPGDSTQTLSYTTSGGTLNVYAWKNQAGNDPTLVASTGTESFAWLVIGY